MKMTVKTTGFKDLEAALAKIEKRSTQKAVMRRALKTAAQPMADVARTKAPDDTSTGAPDLKSSITVGTKLSERQKRVHRKMFRNDKASVEMFVGAGPVRSANQQEFGNEHHGPQPFMRPAWDQEAMPTLERLGQEMWSEIDKQAKRAAKKAAKGK